MPVLTVALSTVTSWVAGEIYEAYKDKYVLPGLKKCLFTPEEYASNLNTAISNTIKKYQETYPSPSKFPFYHHKETFAQLSKYILFKNDEENILKSINFSEIENIDKPTLEQVEHFYSFFLDEIKSNEKLKELYLEENYQEKIFDIYKEVSLIKNIIEDFLKNTPKTESIIRKWVEQIYGNLQKLKSTTALEEINHFETEILPANQISDQNKAFVYFVKGLCLNENNKPQEALEYFEQACLLDPDNSSYKTWCLYLKYLFKNSKEVLADVNTSLRSNSFNPILNSIVMMESIKNEYGFNYQSVAIAVRNNIRYKRIIYRYYIVKGHIPQALEYFETDSTDISSEVGNVSIDNYSYLDYYLQISYIRLLNKYPNYLFFELNSDLQKSPELQTCIDNVEKYLSKLKSSEKENLKNLYSYLLQILLFLKIGDRTYLENAFAIFQTNKDLINPYHFNVMKYGFSQVGDYSKTLALFAEKEPTAEDYYFKFALYRKLGDIDNMKISASHYLQNVKQIDDQNSELIIDLIINRLLSISELNPFYARLINNEIAIDGIYKDILLSTNGLADESHKEASVKILENNFKAICDTPIEKIELINSYCRILTSYELWQGVVTILESKTLSTFNSNALLVTALKHSKLNSTKLLNTLELLRNSSFPQIPEYYIWEINLNLLLNAWEKIEEIALKGKVSFEQDKAFDYYLAISYMKQGKKDKYCQLVNNLNLLDFQFPNFPLLIQGLVQFEDFPSAIEWSYKYAIKSKGPDPKMLFFNTFLFNCLGIDLSLPIYCEAGYFITIESSNNTQTVNDLEHKSIYNKLIGKKIGECFTLPVAITGKEVEYKIIGVQHKYEFLIDEIRKEAEQPEITGLPMQMFQVSEGNILEDFNQKMIELFGESSDKRHEFVEKTFNKYKINEISFVQVIRTVFDDNAIDAYLTVINSPNIGFKIPPLTLFKEIEEKPIEQACIDIPTILLLSGISSSLSITPPKKFIVSQHTIDYFNEMLDAIKHNTKSQYSVSVSSSEVIRYNQKEIYNEQIEAINNALRWIENNCEVHKPTSQLDYLVHLQDNNSNLSNLVLSYMDTIALTIEKDIKLISDDMTTWHLLHASPNIVSTEYYLINSGLDSILIYEYLAARNYIGISSPIEKAKDIALLVINNEATGVLQNFSLKKSNNLTNCSTLIYVMKNILAEEISEKDKKSIINKLFTNLLEGMYINESLVNDIVVFIRLSIWKAFLDDATNYRLLNLELDAVLIDNGYSQANDDQYAS